MMSECFVVGLMSDVGSALRDRLFDEGTKESENEEKSSMKSKKSSTEVSRIRLDQFLNCFIIDSRLNRHEMLSAVGSIGIDETLENCQFVHHVIFDELENPTELIDESKQRRRRRRRRRSKTRRFT